MPLIAAQTTIVDNRTVEFALAGRGSPAAVLVNGSGGHLDAWFRIFKPLAADGQLLAYNRPGIGRSSPSPEPQTASTCARDLLALLRALGLNSPILAVGHSFGGLITNYFARAHPTRVAAMVLIESSTPEDIRESERLRSSPRLLDRIGSLLTPRKPSSELAHAGVSADETDEAGPFPPIPLTVLSGAKSAMGTLVPRTFSESRARNQRALAALSPQGGHVIAARSGHFPQMSEPELVTRTVMDMRRQLREADRG